MAESPLRRRMIEVMTIRNLSPATQQSYVPAVSKFSRYSGRSPDRLGLGVPPLPLRISGVSEVVEAFARGDVVDCDVDGSAGHFAQRIFDLGEHLFDGVHIGAVEGAETVFRRRRLQWLGGRRRLSGRRDCP